MNIKKGNRWLAILGVVILVFSSASYSNVIYDESAMYLGSPLYNSYNEVEDGVLRIARAGLSKDSTNDSYHLTLVVEKNSEASDEIVLKNKEYQLKLINDQIGQSNSATITDTEVSYSSGCITTDRGISINGRGQCQFTITGEMQDIANGATTKANRYVVIVPYARKKDGKITKHIAQVELRVLDDSILKFSLQELPNTAGYSLVIDNPAVSTSKKLRRLQKNNSCVRLAAAVKPKFNIPAAGSYTINLMERAQVFTGLKQCQEYITFDFRNEDSAAIYQVSVPITIVYKPSWLHTNRLSVGVSAIVGIVGALGGKLLHNCWYGKDSMATEVTEGGAGEPPVVAEEAEVHNEFLGGHAEQPGEVDTNEEVATEVGETAEAEANGWHNENSGHGSHGRQGHVVTLRNILSRFFTFGNFGGGSALFINREVVPLENFKKFLFPEGRSTDPFPEIDLATREQAREAFTALKYRFVVENKGEKRIPFLRLRPSMAKLRQVLDSAEEQPEVEENIVTEVATNSEPRVAYEASRERDRELREEVGAVTAGTANSREEHRRVLRDIFNNLHITFKRTAIYTKMQRGDEQIGVGSLEKLFYPEKDTNQRFSNIDSEVRQQGQEALAALNYKFIQEGRVARLFQGRDRSSITRLYEELYPEEQPEVETTERAAVGAEESESIASLTETEEEPAEETGR